MNDRVRFDVGSDRVGVVLLDRPDKLNAMDRDLFAGLHGAAEQAREAIADGRCGAVLVSGAGRAFSAGLDVSLFGEIGQGISDEQIAWLQEAFTVFEDLTAPTVAAVRGVALGGGCQLALACHLRVAAPDASFGLLETRWGIIPDLGGTYRLPRIVGLARAVDLGVSARRIDAETALSWGLVDAVLDDADFDAAARAWVARLAAGPTVATGAIPRLMREGLASARDEALAAERTAQRACLASADFAEAVGAAVEGREPRFGGR
jgi:enoyl-CoA hydratase/carnithine racemase